MNFANYKTTFAGLIGGIAVALLPIIQGGHWDWKSIGTGAVIAVLGFLAKDFDTTGTGTTATKP